MPKNRRACPIKRLREIKVGPRGGQYYATPSGRKSYCNPKVAADRRRLVRKRRNATSEVRRKRPAAQHLKNREVRAKSPEAKASEAKAAKAKSKSPVGKVITDVP